MNPLELCSYVFVYGTLKRGFHNHHLLRSSSLLGEAMTQDSYLMFGRGVPYIMPGGYYPVAGEVYAVEDEEVMSLLDRLEGHPTMYCREVIPVRLAQGQEMKAWCYLCPREETQGQHTVTTEGLTYNTFLER